MLAVPILFILLSALARTEAGPLSKKRDGMDEFHLSDLCAEITDNEEKKENCLKCFLDIAEPDKNKNDVLRCAENLPIKIADCIKKMAQIEGKKKYEKCNKNSVEIAARVEREEEEKEIGGKEESEEESSKEGISTAELAAVKEDAKNGEEDLEESEQKTDDDDDAETEKIAEVEQEEEETEAKIEIDDEETKRMDAYWKDCFEDLLDKLLSRISHNSSQNYEKISSAIAHCSSEKIEETEESEAGVKGEEATAEAEDVKTDEGAAETEELRVESVKGGFAKAEVNNSNWNTTESSTALEQSKKYQDRRKREESENSRETDDDDEDKEKAKIECQVKAISEDKELIEIMKEAVLEVEFPIPYQIVRLLLTET